MPKYPSDRTVLTRQSSLREKTQHVRMREIYHNVFFLRAHEGADPPTRSCRWGCDGNGIFGEGYLSGKGLQSPFRTVTIATKVSSRCKESMLWRKRTRPQVSIFFNA